MLPLAVRRAPPWAGGVGWRPPGTAAHRTPAAEAGHRRCKGQSFHPPERKDLLGGRGKGSPPGTWGVPVVCASAVGSSAVSVIRPAIPVAVTTVAVAVAPAVVVSTAPASATAATTTSPGSGELDTPALITWTGEVSQKSSLSVPGMMSSGVAPSCGGQMQPKSSFCIAHRLACE